MPASSSPSRLALLALACAPACGSTGSQRGLTPVEELPPEYRAALASYGAGAERWLAEREQYVSDPALAAFLVDNLVLEMFRAYDGARLYEPGQLRGPFERAQDELVRLEEHSAPVLIEILCTGDGVQAFLAADTLAQMSADQAEPVAACLTREAPGARRRAAELLAELPYAGDFEDELETALAACVDDDPEWIVRAQAARTLAARAKGHTQRSTARSALTRALADADRTVACEAAEGLVALGDPKVTPALINFLERGVQDGDLRKVNAAQDGLRALTGVTRKMDVAGWRGWWHANRTSLIRSGEGATGTDDSRDETPRG